MEDLLLFPFNGNAREALGVIQAINENNPTWNLIGFIDDDPSRHGNRFGGHSVIGGREVFDLYPNAKIIAAHGRPENFQERTQILNGLNLNKQRFTTIIHPSAHIGPDCRIGRNCIIMAGVCITAGVDIADDVIILPNTVISHETKVGQATLIGSNVSISGGVVIEQACYIGSGTKIIQEVTIGSGSLIGIGSVVINSVPRNSIIVGNPARPINSKRIS